MPDGVASIVWEVLRIVPLGPINVSLFRNFTGSPRIWRRNVVKRISKWFLATGISMQMLSGATVEMAPGFSS